MQKKRLPAPRASDPVEWPTLALLAGCYLVWSIAVLGGGPIWASVPALAIAVALHGSLTHEAIHGHPFRDPRWNAAAVWPALSVVLPYGRFRDTHLAHHRDALLTDPYDDPESNYLDPAVWTRLPWPVRAVLRANNTLLGRMALGPAIGTGVFLVGDLRLALRDRAVRRAWLAHLPAAAAVLALVAVAPMPFWAYAAGVYLGLSLLRIRTFLEHQAHARARARTVIVEDRGPLALLFLNNNLHVVHHMHPRVPWYRLPAVYAAQRDRYLARNDGYVYRSYGEVFRRYLLAPKDPVPHPLWRRGAAAAPPLPVAAVGSPDEVRG
ncbi:fatty acid desaturase [Rhodobacteraceae bacterium CCMM004]|nr:fatty acid desaturase [Rhodobacteraceae bacterium CCMM004]